MINFLLLFFILLFLIYALYDQFGMDRMKGATLLKVRLKKRAKTDAVILIILIVLLIYQIIPELTALSVYLFAVVIILAVYGAFVRFPVLLIKQSGFFYGNLFTDYGKIRAINLTEDNILVIDLNSGKRLLIQPESAVDFARIFTVLMQLGVISKDSQHTLNQFSGK